MAGRRRSSKAAARGSIAFAAVAAVALAAAGCEPRTGAAANPAPSSSAVSAAPRSASLLPSRLVELAQIEEEKARALERTLASLPGVSEARVHLVLPTPAPLLGDAPAQPGKAAVLLQFQGPDAPPQASDVQRLVAGATRGLEPHHVEVLVQLTPKAPLAAPVLAAPELVRFGPISVEKGSAPLARIVLAAAALTGLMLTAVLLGMWLTLRRRGSRAGGAPTSGDFRRA